MAYDVGERGERMKPSTVAGACAGAILAVFAIVSVAQQPAALTRGADVPMEVVAYRADLVVLAKVVEKQRPRAVAIQPPGELQPRARQMQLVRVELLRVFKDSANPYSAPSTRRAGTGNAPATRPADAPGEKPAQIEVYVSAPATPLVTSDAPELQTGKQYLLVLYHIPGRVSYYLPDDARGRVAAGGLNAARMEKAVDVSKWAWGAASGGLEVALLVGSPVTLPKRGPLYLHGLVAMRNISDEAISVNIDPEGKPLDVAASGEKDARVKSEFYARPRKLRPGTSPTVTIAPGAVVFLGPSGRSDFAWGFEMPLTPGRWSLQCGYRNSREVPADKKEAWRGEVRSAPVEVEVRSLTPASDAKRTPAS